MKQIQEGFITNEGLEELSKYKYKSGGYTWLDNQMNYFWEWTVKQVPLWVAPNLITFIGWLFVIFSYANILRYDYTFSKDIPSWCFFFAAGCIFIYSTLDAIDGKQARRTSTSSPLGQLFDHGCDSFSMTFFILAICQALKMSLMEVFILFIACQISFWSSNWMQYNTGVLTTKVGQFGVTEAEFTCAAIHLITGFFGQDFWQITLGSLIPQFLIVLPPQLSVIKVGTVVVYIYSTLIFLMCSYVFLSTLYKCVGQRIKVICQFFSLYLVIGMEFVWMHLEIYQKYNGIILVNFGILASLLICKMIICSVTKMKFAYFHNELIAFLISTMLMIFFDLQQNIENMIIVFWICFAINLFSIFRFLYLVIQQLTHHLGIYCFSIGKRPKIV